MTLTKSDKNWIQNLVEDQEIKNESKIMEVKDDFYNKIDPI